MNRFDPSRVADGLREAVAQDGSGQDAVLRAIEDLRRGNPVLVVPGDARETGLLVIAAETATGSGLERFEGSTGGAREGWRILLSASRAASVLRDGVDEVDGVPEGGVACFRSEAVTSGAADLTAMLMDLADPTRPGGIGARSAALAGDALPRDADAALILLKHARLLPACLVAAVGRAGAGAEGLVQAVSAGAVRGFARLGARSLAVVASAPVPLEDAPDARIVAFRGPGSGVEHMAIVIGDPAGPGGRGSAPLVRLHSECFTGDLLGSLRCDCGDQLRSAIRVMAAEGAGVVLYLGQEGRGIGLVNKLRAYSLQDGGLDTIEANRALGFEADERDFEAAATMLEALGIGRIRLLTNNPDKIAQLEGFGIEVVERVAHVMPANGINDGYLRTKKLRFGHLVD